MATNFPTSVDNFTNPTANDSLNLPSHSTQHANANDAIEAVESYLLTEPFGMRLVKKQTIGSAVTSVTVTNAFSATYENYLIRIAGGVASAQTDLDIQIGNATSAYNYTSIYTRFDTGTVEGLRANSTTEFRYSGGANTTNLQMDCNIDTPFLTRPTILTARHIVASANGLTMQTWGYLANNNSYTDIKIFPATGTLTGGTIYVYGYTI